MNKIYNIIASRRLEEVQANRMQNLEPSNPVILPLPVAANVKVLWTWLGPVVEVGGCLGHGACNFSLTICNKFPNL